MQGSDFEQKGNNEEFTREKFEITACKGQLLNYNMSTLAR